jgi:uracil-DNA glycosylase
MTHAQLRALVPVDWRATLYGNLPEKELEQLARALSDERRVVLPARDQWFRALDETPLSEVRAVILGQDPYPTQGQAEGLAFSVPDRMLPMPPSLMRILSEAAREAKIASGRTSLLQWATPGVLLLNAALTVPEGTAGGHAKIGWQAVTDAILRAVASQPGPVVFMPWGTHARAAVRRAGIGDGRPHILCPSVHPTERRGAFIGSDLFGCANDRLRAIGLERIDWSLA